MRVGAAVRMSNDERIFAITSLGLQNSRQRQAQTRVTVQYARLRSTMQRLLSSGARIISVTALRANNQDDQPVSVTPIIPAAVPLTSSSPTKPVMQKTVPVNLYKPKKPLIFVIF